MQPLYEATDEASERSAAALAAERLIRLYAVTAVLSTAMTPEEVATVIVEQGIAVLGAYAGGVSLLSDDGTYIKVLRLRGYDSDIQETWSEIPARQATPLTTAIMSGQPVYLSSRAEWDRAYPDLLPLAHSRAWTAVPLVVDSHVIGGLTLSFAAEQTFSPEDRSCIEVLAHQCAQAIERARLYTAERAARVLAETAWKRLKLLSEASTLLATTLNYDATLANLTRLLVPEFADICTVHLVSDTGALTFAAVAHVDPHKEALVRLSNMRYPPTLDPPSGVGALFLRGEPVLIEPIPKTLFHELAVDAMHEAYMHELEPISGMFVPLRSRGQLLGSISLCMAESGRHYKPDDLAMAEELARRGAAAIDKALLYRDAQQARASAEQAAARTMQLQSVTAALSEALTPEDVANVIVQAGSAAFAADAGAVYRLSDNNQAFELVAYIGYSAELISQYQRIPLSQAGPLRDAMLSGEPVIVETAAELIARWPHLKAVRSQSGDVSTVAVPLLVDRRAYGVLYLAFRTERRLSPDDRTFLTTLSHQCAQALERAQLYEREHHARTVSEEALRLRDVFLMTASHELKTPLTSILGNAQLLQRRASREGGFSEQNRHAIEVIGEQAGRMKKMVTALLDISRIETGQLTIEPAPFDLAALVRRVVAALEQRLTRHRIRSVLPDEVMLIEGDAVRLEQVLDNLLQNAIKYSPGGGQIEVRLGRQAAQLHLAVADQGIGIPPEALKQVFTKFYRASNVNPQQISGFGIGLSVVAEIVKLHGGTIHVESSEGVGSTFTICLPAPQT